MTDATGSGNQGRTGLMPPVDVPGEMFLSVLVEVTSAVARDTEALVRDRHAARLSAA
ncbi:hypothetical protein [Salinigranum sp. GCM10025319]|uniref:hypothetical protein n=1 Tax=Salinigranum sp. GCM10025319 TaxID=3252687 RepID=UPI00360D3F71